jgi:hypothetical protein
MAQRFQGASRLACVAALGLALVGLVGCEEEKKTSAPVADAGAQDASAGPVLGGRLGAAVAAAANAPPSANPGAPPGGAGAPPETGIFEAAAADAAQGPLAPPKIELFDTGKEPKLPLSYAFAAGAERKTAMLLQVRAAQQGNAPFVVDLVFKSDKPKDEKKADKDKAEPAPVPSGLPVSVKIAKIKPIRGDLPKELDKITDGVVRYRLSPSGVATDIAVEYPKDATPGIELVLGALADAVLAMTTPLPDKPVGVGAYWMITDRARSSGVDVVRYRVAKVEKTEGKTATISIEVRQYAANTTLGLPGLPKDVDVSLEKYEAQGKGQLEVAADPFLPLRGQMQIAMQSLLKSANPVPGQQPGQRLVIQTDTKAVLNAAP